MSTENVSKSKSKTKTQLSAKKKKHSEEETVAPVRKKKKRPAEETVETVKVKKKKRPVEDIPEHVSKKKKHTSENSAAPVKKKKPSSEQSVRKKSAASHSSAPKKKKVRLKKNVKIGLFVICFAAVGCAILAMKPARMNSAEANATNTETETETVQTTVPETEPPTTETEPPTTEPPTTEPIDENLPFIDYNLEIDPNKPMVAITYDDGPAADSSAVILDVLEENNAHATFFVVGQNITPETKKIIQREAELGCEVGNHTWDHGNLRDMELESGLKEIHDCDDAVYKIIHRYPQHIRPPYGSYTDELRAQEKRSFIYWSLDTNDWKWRDADKVYSLVMDNVSDGDIILMHDIHPETAEASKRIIPDLIAEGYQLVTISELIHYRGFPEEDSMLIYNIHPVDPLYESMFGTVISFGNDPEEEGAEEANTDGSDIGNENMNENADDLISDDNAEENYNTAGEEAYAENAPEGFA